MSFARSQTIAISGKITDENQRNVYGAIVRLKNLKLTDTTDAEGNYSFNVAKVKSINLPSNYEKPFFKGNFLIFTVSKSNEPVEIKTFDCRGKCVYEYNNKIMALGQYKIIPFPAYFSSQMYICRINIGKSISTYIKKVPSVASLERINYKQKTANLSKITAAVDTLLISRAGYLYKKYPIDSYTGIYNVTLTVSVTISFDLDTYQGIDYPMTITVKDPYANSATVDAIATTKLYPTPDTIKLNQIPGSPGAYEKPVYFAVRSTKPGKDTIRTHDNDSIFVFYKAAAPLTNVVTSNAVWKAMTPSIRPSVSIYLGLRNPININAEDRNITDTSITIHLASKKDTVGFDVVLKLLPGAFGAYSGAVGASLTQSVPGKVIAVRPPIDTLTTIYQSPALNTPVISSAFEGTALLWKATNVMILPDSLGTGYHGTSSKMKITAENDHIVANSMNVNIKSKKDPTGIILPLNVDPDTSFIFSGVVGFTLGTSSSASKLISVSGKDTVTISYYDMIMVPPETVSVSVTWQP